MWAAALLTTGEILTHTPPYDCVTILLTLIQISHAFSSTDIFRGHALQPFVHHYIKVEWRSYRQAAVSGRSSHYRATRQKIYCFGTSLAFRGSSFFFFSQPQLLCYILPHAVVNKECPERHFLLESTLERDEAE